MGHRPAVLWALVTGAVAVVATGVDALLLERSRGFFTGGFLAAVQVRGPLDAFGFTLSSLVADAAVAGPFVAMALWAASRRRYRRSTCLWLATMAGLFPAAVGAFLSFRLARYFGDAFDLSLMFDLTGRRASELMAVGTTQAALPVLLVLAVTGAAGSSAWLVERWSRSQEARPFGLWPILLGSLGLVAIASAGTAVLRAHSELLDDGLRRKASGRILGAAVEYVMDVDRDGYGWLSRPADPDPFDSRVFPYAVDLPGNGIDENGLGGDLSPDLPRYEEPDRPVRPGPHQPTVVLFVLESVRADSVGATWRGRPVTPVLDDLARQGISSQRAYSHNGYTAQSRQHLLTGSMAGLRRGSVIDDFRARGYETAYFSGQDESFGGMAILGETADHFYDARADRDRRYSLFSTPGSLAVPFAVVEERVAEFLARRDAGRPLFLYVNLHDTHYPYHHAGVAPLLDAPVLRTRAIGPERTADLQGMYLNTLANVDAAIGRVLDDVRRRSPGEPGVVVIGDHGESLFDEGFLGHGYALNDAQTRIPLIAAGLRLSLPEPFGQALLRDVLGDALERGPGRPELTRAEAPVFQYVGTIERPRVIRFLGAEGSVTYDFRAGAATADASRPTPLAALPSGVRSRVLELTTLWERMILARHLGRERD